jgi:hypothetical protein
MIKIETRMTMDAWNTTILGQRPQRTMPKLKDSIDIGRTRNMR